MLKKKSLIFCLLFGLLLTLSLPGIAFDNGSFYGSEKTETEISGSISPELRIMSDDGDIEENLGGELEFNYPGSTNQFKVLIDYQLGAADEIDFNELYYKYSASSYDVLIGRHRVIWGKGDKVHVVDNLNPEDLSDFINPDYKERQIGEEMLKIDKYFRGGNADLEFVYTPDFEGNRLADDPDSSLGNWVINPFASLISLRELSAATGLSQTDLINEVEDAIDEENNQFGLRFTDSRGSIDYGFSYYKGYLRDPSYNVAAVASSAASWSGGSISKSELKEALNNADLHYDSVDIFGFEMAKVIASINSRFELAYYRTDDTDGDNPLVRNNKIAWVIGGDRDLPISNLNLNIQFAGEKILDHSGLSQFDIDYDADDDYTTNRAIVKLKDSYNNEKIEPELTWIYNLAGHDYSLEAAVNYELKQDLELELSHKIFNGDNDTTFGQFSDNDFTSIALKYSF
ncbi:DUF1302 family protein [Halanaerobium salsuginis]|jgi:hypothetical protein|uniref:Beta-barrel porin 2 n=1 Tax=Halanaerobium salsuginis TaxID=29563 RepID=A0A1I4J0K0_9FIRM|nr:DUF1302 family protein [Halanaerobium salsuginis]SFL60060.1 hypothetical protein SAMN02983006_01558 [Halanaerobium salsuginis]